MAKKEGTHERGRLWARPASGVGPGAAPVGLRPLGSGDARHGYLYVPAGYDPRSGRPAPLALLLHGATGRAGDALALLRGQADAAGLILLAPNSRGYTWDVLLGGYGPDVAAIDRALELAFSRHAIDPARVAAGGFSDGASYALSLGTANGDLFTHVLAFSPGFVAPGARRGSPRIFVSHGARDAVLPIHLCSRRIVPALERSGYDVRYREFGGGHAVPPGISREAAVWFAAEPAERD